MPAPFIIGWEEWVSLPELGLPAVKAKIDTGARTSALHAHLIEPFGPIDAPLVRFSVYPIGGRTDIEITCSAPVIGRREVTSSNGERERRYVIATPIQMGERTWPVEITLTNRETMAYRMLIGRQAIAEDMFVDPTSSFRQRRLSYLQYRQLPRRDPVHRSLRMAILTRRPTARGPSRLARIASERGHVVETLDLARMEMTFDGASPGCRIDKLPLPHFDAVIPRIGGGSSAYARSILRQLELMGSYALNSADALDRLAHALHLRQHLALNGIATTGPARVGEDGASDALGRTEPARRITMLVVGRTVVAAIENRRGVFKAMEEPPGKEARKLALRAARALGLRLAAIDIVTQAESFLVAGVSAVPPLSRFASIAGVSAEKHVIADAEAHVRSWIRRNEPEATSG
ncbi:MAG: ATP-dependent zinc protease [Hyphomicrobiaceae bacterium]|nr:ATP-dependent zinc protease [Hyphomicrobiaceae bacterium]